MYVFLDTHFEYVVVLNFVSSQDENIVKTDSHLVAPVVFDISHISLLHKLLFADLNRTKVLRNAVDYLPDMKRNRNGCRAEYSNIRSLTR